MKNVTILIPALAIGLIAMAAIMGCPGSEAAIARDRAPDLEASGADASGTDASGEEASGDQGCQMAIARFLDCMCLALLA